MATLQPLEISNEVQSTDNETSIDNQDRQVQPDHEFKTNPKMNPFSCNICKESFSQPTDLANHYETTHSSNKTKVESEARDDIVIVNRSLFCEFCGKKFASRYGVVRHEKIHTQSLEGKSIL